MTVTQATAPAVSADAQSAIQTPTSEGLPPSVSPEPSDSEAAKDEPDFTKQFAALKRRERALLDREKTFKAERESLQVRLKAVEEVEALLAEAKVNPLKVFEKTGWTFEQLVEWRLNNGKFTPEQRVEQLERSLAERDERTKAEREAAEKERQEREETETSQRQEAAVKHVHRLINEHIDSNPETCELIRVYKSQDLVFEVMDRYYNATIDPETGRGQILQVADAAAQVEKYLETETEGLLNTKKVGSRFAVKEPAKAQALPPRTPGTLTNAATTSPPAPPSTRMLSDDESKANIAAWLNKKFQEQKR